MLLVPQENGQRDQKMGAGVILTRFLYKAARASNNISAAASGKPSRIARRAKNVAVGRALGRAGFWRSLWK
jgi:hypothetical protein